MFGIKRRKFTIEDAKRMLEDERARETKGPSLGEKAFEFIERMGKLPVHRMTDFSSYLAAGTTKVWAAFRACHITAGVLVKTQFNIVGPDGQTVKGGDPELQRLMTQPNPFDSWEELTYVWTHHMKMTGNAFWLKDELDGRGRPKSLYPLMPQNVKIIPDARTKIAGYEYSVNTRTIKLGVEDVIHFRRPSPTDSIMGIGDIEAAQTLFNSQINRNVYDERFLENGASPSGVLMKEQAVESESEWAKFKAWWDQHYSGKKNIGKTAFLNGKWSYQQLGLSSQAMQSLERDSSNIQNIFTAMGVPLSVAGIDKAANLAVARQDDINFRKYECVPLIDILVGKLNGNQGFIAPFGKFRLDYSLSGLIDVEQVMKDYQPLFDRGGLTINELRELAGLAKTTNPLHDQYYTLKGAIPLEMAGLSDPPSADLQKIVAGLTNT